MLGFFHKVRKAPAPFSCSFWYEEEWPSPIFPWPSQPPRRARASCRGDCCRQRYKECRSLRTGKGKCRTAGKAKGKDKGKAKAKAKAKPKANVEIAKANNKRKCKAKG